MADRYFQTNFGRSNRVARPDFSSQFNVPNTVETDTDWEMSKVYEEPLRRYRTILSEEMPALQRLRNLGALVPKREEYTPGFGGKLSAALAGFAAGFGNPAAAYQTAVQAREAPYRRALEDFGIEKEILGEEAELERYDRSNRLSGAKAELEALDDMLTQQRQFNDSRSQAALRQIQGRERESLIKEREYNRNNPELQPFETTTGINWYNKRDPNDVVSTGARTLGGFNAQTGRMNAETSRGNLGLSRERLNEDIQQNMFSRMSADRNYDISKTRANAYTDYLGRGRATPSPAAQARARQLTANELLALNPAYKKFINQKGEYVNKGWGQGYGPDDTNFLKFKQEFEDRVDEILGRNKLNYDDLPDQ